MKRIIILMLVVMMIGLTGCSQEEENKQILQQQKKEISELKGEIAELQKTKIELDSYVLEQKEVKGIASYIVTIEIKQSHMFWDIEANIKDEINAIEIEIPVSKEYYDAVEVGTVINDDFRVGSLLMSSSIGSWDVTISAKEIR